LAASGAVVYANEGGKMRTIVFAVSWTWLAVAWSPWILAAQTLDCVGREVSRTRLLVDGGRELYVEPSVLAVSGSRTLLAGKPSYLFLKREPDEAAEVESRNTVFAVVLEADGSAQLVPPPPVAGSMLAAVAGVGALSNSWRVIFAEVDSVGVDDPNVEAFWHGIYDGRVWSFLERLPQPSGKTLQYLNTSPIGETADTVVWAALTTFEEHQQSVVVFERRGGVWSYQILATPFASRGEALHTPGIGFVLAVTHKDAGNPPARSAFIYSRRSGWTSPQQIPVVGTDGRALPPPNNFFASLDSTTAIVAFTAPMPLALGNREEPLFAVARPFGDAFATVVLGDGSILWATEHTDSSGVRELRLVRPLPDSTAIIWRSPNPFRGPFNAVGLPSSDVMIVGPELDETHGVLASLIVRLRIGCSTGQKTGG
jgi:hypothetical protein